MEVLKSRLGFKVYFKQYKKLEGRLVHIERGRTVSHALNIRIEYPIGYNNCDVWATMSGMSKQCYIDSGILQDKVVPFHTGKNGANGNPAYLEYYSARGQLVKLSQLFPKTVYHLVFMFPDAKEEIFEAYANKHAPIRKKITTTIKRPGGKKVRKIRRRNFPKLCNQCKESDGYISQLDNSICNCNVCTDNITKK